MEDNVAWPEVGDEEFRQTRVESKAKIYEESKSRAVRQWYYTDESKRKEECRRRKEIQTKKGSE